MVKLSEVQKSAGEFSHGLDIKFEEYLEKTQGHKLVNGFTIHLIYSFNYVVQEV